jgi:hypothetical protein|tara:strand:+ start:1519 stop:1707 length:189 start_codon:yes stop_codon:yes gene_type:complete
MTLKVYKFEGQWIVRLAGIGANKLSQNRYGKILDTFPTKKKADQFVNNINNAVAQYIQGESK